MWDFTKHACRVRQLSLGVLSGLTVAGCATPESGLPLLPPPSSLTRSTAAVPGGSNHARHNESLTRVSFQTTVGGDDPVQDAGAAGQVGKMAGGLFVWAMAILDAYKTARIRHAVWSHARPKS